MGAFDDLIPGGAFDDLIPKSVKDRYAKSKQDVEQSRQDIAALGKNTALPALNDGIAQMLGIPVELVNSVLRAVGFEMSDAPVGGKQTFKKGMETAGINTTAKEDTAAEQVVGALSRGAGSGAVLGPAGMVPGAVSGLTSYLGGQAGEEVGGFVGGEGGAKVGKKVGEVAGAFAPMGATAVAKGTGNALSPKHPGEVDMLRKGGVQVTPMTAAGGEFQRVEQGMVSAPVAGRSIKTQLEQMEDSFVTATVNRALAPIGEKLSPGTKAGHNAVDEMVTKLSDAYDDILPQLKVIRGQQFDDDVATALAQTIPGKGRLAREAREEFSDLFNNHVIERFDRLGTMSGREFKEADSILGQTAKKYMKADDPRKQQVGEALKAAQIALRNMVSRNNPDLADDLNKINQAYAMSLRVEAAADAAKHTGGKFTPGQLETAVTSKANATQRESARGQALMQDWAKAAEKVIVRQVADSGTPFRTAVLSGLARPMGFAQGTLGAFGANAGLNAALRGATHLTRLKTPNAAIPVGMSGSLMTGQ